LQRYKDKKIEFVAKTQILYQREWAAEKKFLTKSNVKLTKSKVKLTKLKVKLTKSKVMTESNLTLVPIYLKSDRLNLN